MRLALAFSMVVLALASVRLAGAQPLDDEPGIAPDRGKLDIVAVPVFGPPSVWPGAWTELLVRIHNRGSEPARGQVIAEGSANHDAMQSRAPFHVNPGASVSLRVPVIVGEWLDPMVEVHSEAGARLYLQGFPRTSDNRTLLVDVARASALGAALRTVVVGSRNDPWGEGGPAAMGSPSTVDVVSPLYDEVTGEPILPRRAAGYTRAAAVLVASADLVGLPALELEALSGYVLGGGTLAVVMSRPEDDRHPVMVSLVGGAMTRGEPHGATLAPLALASLGSAFPYAKPQPAQSAPERAVHDTLVGFRGGNLVPSAYGASAAYGLGEVHVLAFDPQAQPSVDSAWVHVRMIDLLRRANERIGGVLFRHGQRQAMAYQVRQELDPNEGSRWAILVSALLLCLYAIIAGPVNYTYWRRKGQPLKALLWQAIVAALAFGAVVVVGVSAKGCSGRARHLTVVEAGAGMKVGNARRWRGFFVPNASDMTIVTSSASSVLSTALTTTSEPPRDNLLIDRDGLRLVDVQLRPWETMVIREDAYASLGEGIALHPLSPSETQVINRSGRRLLGLVLHQPKVGALYLRTLDDGASASSSTFAAVPRAAIGLPTTATTLALVDFNMHAVASELDTAAAGLAQAWAAVADSIPVRKNWFPADVPVLLAQLEGGEGAPSDTGLSIDSDRVLVRIVGYGGAP